MSLTYRRRARAQVFVFFFLTLGLALGLALTGAALATAPPSLRIKNGHKLMVALGKTRQAAIGIRPEKKVWTLELTGQLAGAAELHDVTPASAGARWTVPIQTERVVLDAARFIPSHVYRLEIRRDRQLVGSALVYLYPPPVERVNQVKFESAPEAPDHRDKASAPGVLPKGGL